MQMNKVIRGDIMEKLYIVIPAYNEEANIEECVMDWYPIVEQYSAGGESRLVIVDDGSKDSTYEKLKEMTRSRPLLCPIIKENGGHGSAVLYGYNYAIKHNADWIFQTDSDRQTNPDEFAGFWKLRKAKDAIIGKRMVRGDGHGRKIIENIVCLILRLIFRVRVQDANAPFRLMKKEILQKYIAKLPVDFNLPNIMITTYFLYFRENIAFLPISFKPRKKGTNSINLKNIILIGWKAIGDFKKLKSDINKV